jgi:hypothetical protein
MHTWKTLIAILALAIAFSPISAARAARSTHVHMHSHHMHHHHMHHHHKHHAWSMSCVGAYMYWHKGRCMDARKK